MAKQEQSAVYNILAFAFKGANTSKDILKQAKAAQVFQGEAILAQAVVERDAKGKVHIWEPGHGAVGAVAGGAVGGLVGLIGGPAGLLVWVASGALIGGLAGKYLGRPIAKGDLEEIGEAMPMDSSAVFVLVQDMQSQAVVDGMKGYNAQVVKLTVGSELSGEIAQYMAGAVHDDKGNVVAGLGGVAADAQGNIVAGGEVGTGSTGAPGATMQDKGSSKTTDQGTSSPP